MKIKIKKLESYYLSIFGKISLSTVVRTQNILWKNIPSRNKIPKV
jgi:hypothetical protein